MPKHWEEVEVRRMEEEEENEDDDWESLHSNYYQYQSSSPFSFPDHPHRHSDDLSVFPPISHEGLAVIPYQPRAPVCLSSSDDSQPSSPPRKPNIPNWVDFGLSLGNSKVISFIGWIRDLGFSKLKSPSLVIFSIPFLVVLWFWVRRRYNRRRWDGQESVEQLKLVIKEKDEKIIQLLEQIAQMNKLLLARYRIPVIKSSKFPTKSRH